jgi:hypothetical protein
MRPAQEAAAMWGSAQNPAYSELQRLRMALKALEFYGGAVERMEALADNYHVRTYSFPNQLPQWADVESDLRHILGDQP